jgi:hypothetical protein
MRTPKPVVAAPNLAVAIPPRRPARVLLTTAYCLLSTAPGAFPCP